MKSKLVAAEEETRVHVVVLDAGEEAFATLTRFAGEAGISAASLTAIGAFERATVGWFDFASKSYRKIEVNEHARPPEQRPADRRRGPVCRHTPP